MAKQQLLLDKKKRDEFRDRLSKKGRYKSSMDESDEELLEGILDLMSEEDNEDSVEVDYDTVRKDPSMLKNLETMGARVKITKESVINRLRGIITEETRPRMKKSELIEQVSRKYAAGDFE